MSQMSQDKRQIIYFPYIFLSRIRSVTYLDFVVQNLKETLESIQENNLKDTIRNMMRQNRIFGKIIEDIGIVQIKGRNDFRPLGSEEKKKVGELRATLFLGGVAKCNTVDGPNAGHYILTSDNFKLLFQNFVLGDPHIGYASGKIVRLSDFGYRVSDIVYEKPLCVLTNSFSCDEKLLNALEQLKKRNRQKYRLILRATDAVMNAYSNSDDLSNASRVLEFSRAFEILFELPERDQRMKFKEAIERYCEPAGERKRRYLSERSNNNKADEVGSRHVMWADRFYVLRNHIIHGESIPDKRFSFYTQLHWDLALWFFLVSVKQIINESIGKQIFFDSIRSKDDKFAYDDGLLRAETEKAARKLFKMRHEKTKQP